MIKTARSFKSISLSLLSSVLLFTSAATPALAQQWATSGSNIYNTNTGNVGIGTTSPINTLTIKKDASSAIGPTVLLFNSSGGFASGGALDFVNYGTGSYPGARIRSVDQGNYGSNLSFWTKANGSDSNPLLERMAIRDNGNVGIGTNTPEYKLDVLGTAKASGAVGINGLNPGAEIGGQITGLAVSGYTGLGGLRVNGADTENTIYQETGNLGITTSPGGSIILNGTTYVNGSILGSDLIHTNGNLEVNGYSTLFGLVTANNGISVHGDNIVSDTNDGEIFIPFTVSGWNSKSVTFPASFDSTPTVFATVKEGGTTFTGQIAEVRISTTTPTGFTLRFRVNSLGNGGSIKFNWMAL